MLGLLQPIEMITFDHHLLSFLIRWVHVAAMALLLSGAILLWGLSAKFKGLERSEQNWLLLFVAERYEFLFWIAMGLIVMTGVGNLGAFGGDLPTSQTAWGQKFIIKLAFVLVFILLSLVRTLLVARLSMARDADTLSLSKTY